MLKGLVRYQAFNKILSLLRLSQSGFNLPHSMGHDFLWFFKSYLNSQVKRISKKELARQGLKTGLLLVFYRL